MLMEIKVPSVGESVTEAVLAQWFKNDGDRVKKDEPLFVIETDKVTLEVVAEADGVLSIKVSEGETVPIGGVVGTIDTEIEVAEEEEPKAPEAGEAVPRPSEAGEKVEKAHKPRPEEKKQTPLVRKEAEETATAAVAAAKPAAAGPQPEKLKDLPLVAPSARRLAAERNIDPAHIQGTGPAGRITKGDVILYLESHQPAVLRDQTTQTAAAASEQGEAETPPEEKLPGAERIRRKPMSPIRQRIASRLLEARQNTAMLTTFNEIDMARVMAIRKQYKDAFNKKHGVNLGMMSFFIKASIEALREFPQINAFIDGKDIIEHHYYHIGVAVGSERGLVVPVIRHADRLSFAQVEKAIVDYVNKINENRLELSDLEGGTFTISNGGVYGSLLSTPILNTPQSGILGMHKIEKRPVVIDDEVVVRPMMYVALSYDHRIVDGREAVTFLKRIKACVENPERMMMEI